MPRLTSRSSIKHCRERPRQAQWLVPAPLCGHANCYRVEELGFAQGRGLSSPALFCEKNFYGQPQVNAAYDPAIVVRKGIPSPTLDNQGSSKGESRLVPGEQCGQRKYTLGVKQCRPQASPSFFASCNQGLHTGGWRPCLGIFWSGHLSFMLASISPSVWARDPAVTAWICQQLFLPHR